jgi:hypothetical protein
MLLVGMVCSGGKDITIHKYRVWWEMEFVIFGREWVS